MALANISTLEILSLAENHINYIDFFKLNGLPNLRQLDLSGNMITSVSGFNTAHLPHLDMIDLSGNSLFSLPSNFFQHSISLQRIDLAYNRFMQIPSVSLSLRQIMFPAALQPVGAVARFNFHANFNEARTTHPSELTSGHILLHPGLRKNLFFRLHYRKIRWHAWRGST